MHTNLIAHGIRSSRLALLPLLAAWLSAPLGAQVINEFVANHTGTDDHEYVEVFGDPSTSYSNLWVVQIEGDAGDDPGNLDSAHQVGTTDGGGFWVTNFLDNVLHNGTMTLLLVESFTGIVDDDLDSNDDGTLESTPWTSVVDSVAVDEQKAGDHTYLTTVHLTPNFDGLSSYEPGGASRLPDGVDTDTVADWRRNDFYGAGLPGFSGNQLPGEAANTPGEPNSALEPAEPILSEFVSDHVGAVDDHEFIEIYADPGQDYSGYSILVVDGENAGNPGRVDQVFALGSTNGGGFWDTGLLADQLGSASFTLLLVEGFTGSSGDDLDITDDGTLDEPYSWTVLVDDVALLSGDAADRVYSSAVLDAVTLGGPPPLGGASRHPYALDTDSAGDWVRNDFDGEGFDGFAGTLSSGEAVNTPGRVTRIPVGDYYAGVDDSDGATLRGALHEIIDDHIRFAYSSSLTDTWDILEQADQDPVDPDYVLTVYKNADYLKEGGGNSYYNREHSWPNTYGFTDNGTDNQPFTDCFHLFISDIAYNSDRGSESFGTCNLACAELGTDVNHGQGGGAGIYPGNSSWSTGSGATGTFEVWHLRRGDLARALLYLDLRYAGGTHGVTGIAEPDLILTDDTGLMQSGNLSVAYMARLAVLLEWHRLDPVDARDRRRNEVIYSYQGNRNPFIDHPEWVSCVFANDCAFFADGFESGDTSAWSSTGRGERGR
ncbi:MAG: hypothetical protein GY856_17900 [bacterium]|nr:hypothetical protein [bacterium]